MCALLHMQELRKASSFHFNFLRWEIQVFKVN